MEEQEIDEINEMLSAESVETIGDLGYSPDAEHWAVAREEILKILRIVSTFPAKSTVFLGFWLDGHNQLRFHANNKDAVLECAIPLQNENYYKTDKVYFVDYNKLQTYITSYNSFVFTFDDKGQIYFETQYSKIMLEMYNLSLADVRKELETDIKWSKYPLTRAQTGVFKTLFGFSASLNDNKVIFTKDTVKADFTLYQHSVSIDEGIEESYIVRRLDLPSIFEISSDEVQFGCTEDRIYYKFSLGILSFIRMNLPTIPEYKSYAVGEKQGSIQFDIKMLRSGLKLTNVLSSSLVEFREEDGNIVMYVTDKARFIVGTGTLSESFTLSTELFTKIIATIDVSSVFVSCTVTEKGIELQLENPDRFYSMSRMTVGAYKRKSKIEDKKSRRVERKAALSEKGKLSENLADKKSASDILDGLEL